MTVVQSKVFHDCQHSLINSGWLLDWDTGWRITLEKIWRKNLNPCSPLCLAVLLTTLKALEHCPAEFVWTSISCDIWTQIYPPSSLRYKIECDRNIGFNKLCSFSKTRRNSYSNFSPALDYHRSAHRPICFLQQFEKITFLWWIFNTATAETVASIVKANRLKK